MNRLQRTRLTTACLLWAAVCLCVVSAEAGVQRTRHRSASKGSSARERHATERPVGEALAPVVDVTVDGVGVFPLSGQTWRSQVLSYPKPVGEQQRVWSGPDFFTFEYGEPCDFRRRDFVKEYGYFGGGSYKIQNGRMVFTVGRRPFYFGFGGIDDDRTRPSNRFGACWGLNLKDRYRLRMVLEQDRPTQWTFGLDSARKGSLRRTRKSFTIPGTAEVVFETDLGYVRNLWQRQRIVGFRFDCLTPGATVKIQSIQIAPSSANVYFRKRFSLPAQPVLAHATYEVTPVYDLYVNGKKVDSGTRFYATSSSLQKTIDLRPDLRAGENVVAYRCEFLSWAPWSEVASWRFEAVAVDRNGTVTHILGDRDWRCSLSAEPGWTDLNFDDSHWRRPKLTPYFNRMDRVKTRVSTGMNPRHMGMLDVAVVGMNLVVGNWYAPSFGMRGFLDLLPIEIGYGDYTVGLFERETGVRLPVDPTSPDRFAKRYQLLTTTYRDRWLQWRAAKLRQFLQRVSERLRAGPNPWRLYVYPTFKHQQIDQMPWLREPTTHHQQCVTGMRDFLLQSGFPLELYRDDPNIRLVAPLVTVGFKGRTADEHLVDHYTWKNNPGTLAAVQQLGSFFINTALDEVDCPATAAKDRPWTGTTRGVFVARGIEDNAMTDFVNVLAHTTPQVVFTQWMDCNMETGAGAQLRRFAREFYVTPDVAFEPLPAEQVRGVLAQSAVGPNGELFLRLVNNSPYQSAGTLELAAAASVEDLVYDVSVSADGEGRYSVTLLPNDIRIFRIRGATSKDVRCVFAFDSEVARTLLDRAKQLLGRRGARARIPPEKLRRLRAARTARDAFAAYQALADYEVFAVTHATGR